MSAPAVDHAYRYAFPSGLEPAGAAGGPRLRLATSGGVEEHPCFFRGKLLAPRRTADLLLTLGEVARTRFHLPLAMLSRLVALADPVITSGGELMRLEAFSSCCGVYARVDLLPGSVDGEWLGRGTTNVDFNPPMRAALAGIGDGEEVRLLVGAGAVELEREAGRVVERKVPLPVRWLKGFVEVQAFQTRMELRLEAGATAARELLRSIPRQPTRGAFFVVPAGARGLRLSQRESAGAVGVGGVERLRVLEPLLRHARGIRVYGEAGGQASGWELDLGSARFTLVLSAESWRGLSGEGQVLSALAAPGLERALPRVRAALAWQAELDAEELTRTTGQDPAEVRGALAALGARGLVGFDLHTGRHYHRELPFDLAAVEALQPRLEAARKLIDEEGVRVVSREEGRIVAMVRGSGVEHRVRLDEADGGVSCSCPWFSKHRGARGPCKHALAVQILEEKVGEGGQAR
jgi:hypothetical protein